MQWKEFIMVKSKLIIITILLCIGAYFIIDIGREVTKPEIQNGISEVTDTQTNIINPLTDEDFVIKDKDNYIELGGKYEDLKTNEKITDTYEPNENRAYYSYFCENFTITTDGNSISCIDLETNILKTSREIRVGDSITKIFKIYGKSKYYKISGENGYYDYHMVGKIITFYVDKTKKVTRIRMELV
jgi:hypothetical protein